MISKDLPGTVTVTHPHGCGHLGEEKAHMVRAMAGFCSNPNVAGVLLVGLGCELITPELIAEELVKAGQRFEILSIQAEGGTTAAVEKGKLLTRRLLAEATSARREAADISELIAGTKCGGSDTLSGLTANPALGAAADMLVTAGGTVILSETPELLGAEHVLARRAASEEVKKRILEITSTTEALIDSVGVDIRGSEPAPGNIKGGITTLEEKALGAIRKGGTSPIRQVVNYAEKPSEKGLIIMDSPAHDAVCNTGLIAAGAQLIAFTTGRGTPLGAPVAPVIKISSNNDVYGRMKDNIDINAGDIVKGTESIQSVGERIFKAIIEVASGKLSRSEVLGHNEFAIHPIGPTV
jgi:altronate dehydratase large subunit